MAVDVVLIVAVLLVAGFITMVVGVALRVDRWE